MNFNDILEKKPKTLLLAMGSGGDIISILHLYWKLKKHNPSVSLGFFEHKDGSCFDSYERSKNMIDPQKCQNFYDTEDTSRCFAPYISSKLNVPLFYFDLAVGVMENVKILKDIIIKNQIEAVIGVDAGGDVFARFDTKILNVITDAMALMVINSACDNSLIAVTAPCADRELNDSQWKGILSSAFREKCFMGVTDLDWDKCSEYDHIVELSDQYGMSYVNKTLSFLANGMFGKFPTPYFFDVVLKPEDLFFYFFSKGFVYENNDFVKIIDLDRSYNENINAVSQYLLEKGIINQSIEDIKNRLGE